MVEQTVQWEYRILTVGSAFTGARDEQIETILNEWGLEGWEAVSYTHLTLPTTPYV